MGIAPGVGDPADGGAGVLAETHILGASTQSFFYIMNHRGDTVALVDQSGDVVGRYEHDAWGNITSHTGQDAYFTFSGKHFDENAGLYYYGFRWYDPVNKRWTQPDPEGLSEGLDLYQFCGNDPINRVDAYGMYWYNVTAEWWQRQVNLSKDILLNSTLNRLPGGWLAVGTVNTVMDVGLAVATTPQGVGRMFEGMAEWSQCMTVNNWLAAMPQGLVHLGEGSGAWWGYPSWEKAAGVFQDVGVAFGTMVAGLSTSLTPTFSRPLFGTPAGLITPRQYFGAMTEEEAIRALTAKYGLPTQYPFKKVWFDKNTGRSFTMHNEMGHGPAHIDITIQPNYKHPKIIFKQ